MSHFAEIEPFGNHFLKSRDTPIEEVGEMRLFLFKSELNLRLKKKILQ